MVHANGDAQFGQPVPSGPAANANAETLFYAALNNAAYAQETSKPNFIASFETEQVTGWDGASVAKPILYERVPVPNIPNLTVYKPILKTADITKPVYFICKGSDSSHEFYWDLSFFLDYSTQTGKQFITSGATAYFAEQAAIRDYIKNYLENETTQSCVLTGHSLGGKFCLDTVAELVRDHINIGHRINSVQYFNPYIFPNTENYRYCFDQAKAGVSLFHQHSIFHIVNWDFASMFVTNPNVGFGQSYLYDHVTDYSGQDMSGITTTRQFLNKLGLDESYQSYANITNHLMSCWTSSLPAHVYESTTLSVINQTAVIGSWQQKSLSNYFRGNTDLRRVYLFKDPNPAAGNEDRLAVNVWHEDAPSSTMFGNQHNFIVIQNYSANKNQYFAYQKDGFNYVSFPLTAHWQDSNGAQVGTSQTIYILQDSQDSGINRFVLAIPSTTPNKEIDVLRIHSGDWNDSVSWNGTLDGVHHGNSLLQETYEAFLTTKSNPLSDKYLRSLWAISFGDIQPLTDNGRRATFGTGITPAETTFEATLGLGHSSGKTNMTTYLRSTACWYRDNSTAYAGDRFLLNSTVNNLYYAAFSGQWSGSPDSVEALAATSPDSEVYNITHSPTTGYWTITNTANTVTPKLFTNVAQSDMGLSNFNDIDINTGTVNENLTVTYNSTVSGERLYQITFMHTNGVKHYLITSQNYYAHNNGSYGYLDSVSQTTLDLNSNFMPTTLWKIADNVATGSGIP